MNIDTFAEEMVISQTDGELTEVVVYDHDGDVDSLNYDRIPIYHNVILSEHEERIKYLENEVAELKEFIEKWKAVGGYDVK